MCDEFRQVIVQESVHALRIWRKTKTRAQSYVAGLDYEQSRAPE